MTSLAIVRQKYRPDGGAERFVTSALSALSRQTQLNITVLTRKWQGDSNPSFNIEICNPLKLGRVSRERGFARSVHKRFSKFDIVQSHERIPGCTIFRAGDGVHKCWLDHRSRILSEVESRRIKNDRFHRYVMQAEREMFEHSNLKAVICNSEMVKKEIVHEFNTNESKIHVIYNCVNLDKFNPNLRHEYRNATRSGFNIPEEATAMLFIGSGFERKGLEASIRAVAQTNANLVVVGQDKQQKKYYNLAEQLGCSGRVHFAGVQNNPQAFYGAVDGLILPTLYDPFPNVTLEAMASGLGVITSNTCGTAEIISNGQNGYVCDALDYRGLSNAVRNFEDKSCALLLGKNARSTVEPFTAERLSQDLLSLYNKVLSD